MKKIVYFLFLVFLFSGFSYSQKNPKTAIEQFSRISYHIVSNSDAVYSVCNTKTLPFLKSLLKNPAPVPPASPQYSVTFTYTGCSTIYDYVSGGTPQNIIMGINAAQKLHLVCMSAPPGDGQSFPNRKTKYYLSTNKGSSWSFISDVTSIRSGFPAITILANGSELIANHSTDGGTVQKTQWYLDAAEGLGAFQRLNNINYGNYIWPRVAPANSISLPNKLFTCASLNATPDSSFWNACTSFIGPGTFSPWHSINSDNAEAYSIAKGSDGRIGIAYKSNGPADYGSAYFMESTDNGVTFSAPLLIYNSNFGSTGDSLAVLKGIQLVYQANVPKVVFELIKQATNGSYFPNWGKNHIRFWSSSLPGSDPNRSIKIADTALVGYHPFINSNTSSSDLLENICRPTIGTSADGTGLFVAFMVPSNYTGGSVDIVSFMDIWLMFSTNAGTNWINPVKINPDSPRLDWGYPCIAPVNDNNSTYFYVNISMLSDSIPGSYISHPNNGESNAKYMSARVELPKNGIMPPAAPSLIFPPNGAIGVSQPVTFDWGDVTGATSYRFQAALNSSFSNLIVDVSNITSSQYTTPAGTFGLGAYWRVFASNSGGSGPSSEIWSFTVIGGNPPPAPVLLTPANGATCIMVTPILDWQSVAEAESYRIQVSTTPTFTSTLIDESGITPSQYYVTNPLNNNTQYYWRVRAINLLGSGNWSNTFNFTTAPAPPPAPSLVAPSNGSTNLPLTFPILWLNAAGATSFRLQISQSSSMNNPVLDTITTATQITVPPGKLNNMTVYYWRICGLNCGGSGMWSLIWTFITGSTGILTYSSEVPDEFKLHNNFPNPFNPVTKIRFDLPKVSNTKLIVFDMLGKEIVTLVNEKLQPGKYEIPFSINNVQSIISSGIYFYRLETDNFVDVKKCVLIK